jgi:hypothetical protein
MSQAIGPFCDLKQDVTSWNYTEGAAVAIEMQEYERERGYFVFNVLNMLGNFYKYSIFSNTL